MNDVYVLTVRISVQVIKLSIEKLKDGVLDVR